MSFNYSKLKGKIKEHFGTQARFAKVMDLSERSMSSKLNCKKEWKQKEILRACEFLSIGIEEIHIYFFTIKVQSDELCY